MSKSWKYNIFHGLWFRECILCRLLSTVTTATCVKHLRQICLLNGLQNDFRGKFWFLWNCIVTRWAVSFSVRALMRQMKFIRFCCDACETKEIPNLQKKFSFLWNFLCWTSFHRLSLSALLWKYFWKQHFPML